MRGNLSARDIYLLKKYLETADKYYLEQSTVAYKAGDNKRMLEIAEERNEIERLRKNLI